MLKNFRTYQLSVDFYRQTQRQKLPAHLSSQLERAASSIVLNLAEGAGRHTKKDQRKFYSIAMGSLRESQAILDLVLTSENQIKDKADYLAANIYKLVQNSS